MSKSGRRHNKYIGTHKYYKLGTKVNIQNDISYIQYIQNDISYVTWKAKTDTNALPFNEKIRLYPFKTV